LLAINKDSGIGGRIRNFPILDSLGTLEGPKFFSDENEAGNGVDRTPIDDAKATDDQPIVDKKELPSSLDDIVAFDDFAKSEGLAKSVNIARYGDILDNPNVNIFPTIQNNHILATSNNLSLDSSQIMPYIFVSRVVESQRDVQIQSFTQATLNPSIGSNHNHSSSYVNGIIGGSRPEVYSTEIVYKPISTKPRVLYQEETNTGYNFSMFPHIMFLNREIYTKQTKTQIDDFAQSNYDVLPEPQITLRPRNKTVNGSFDNYRPIIRSEIKIDYELKLKPNIEVNTGVNSDYNHISKAVHLDSVLNNEISLQNSNDNTQESENTISNTISNVLNSVISNFKPLEQYLEAVNDNPISQEAASDNVLGFNREIKKLHPNNERKRKKECAGAAKQKLRNPYISEKKRKFFDNKSRKISACPVKPKLNTIEDAFENDNKIYYNDNERKSNLCAVTPGLRELNLFGDNALLKHHGIGDLTSIDRSLVSSQGKYNIRYKKALDFDKLAHEVNAKTYVTKANSLAAIVDKTLFSQGLIPEWSITESGELFLKGIMGVRHAAKAVDVDYMVKVYDTKSGEETLLSLDHTFSSQDINSGRYKLEIVAKAYSNGNKSNVINFPNISYGNLSLTELKYDSSIIREEPMSGTGSIDEITPNIGTYQIVVHLQGTYDRESEEMEGAWSLSDITITQSDLNDSSDYTMEVRTQDGKNKKITTKANRLSAIIHKKLKEQGLEGLFMESYTHKDAEGQEYQQGGKFNTNAVYLAYVTGVKEALKKIDPRIAPNEIGILVEEIIQNNQANNNYILEKNKLKIAA